MILTLESTEQSWIPLDNRDNVLKKLLLKEKCINCKNSMVDNEKIDFVIPTNGKIKWWHHGCFT